MFGASFFYMLYFQEPGVADEELGRDPVATIGRLMHGSGSDESAMLRMLAPGPEGFIERMPEADGLPDWISQPEFDHYVAEFTRTGFSGPLNWYRNLDRNWELMATPAADPSPRPRSSSAGPPTPCCRSWMPVGHPSWSPAPTARSSSTAQATGFSRSGPPR